VRALDPDEVPTLPVRPGAFINPSDAEYEGVPEDPGDRPALQDAPPPASRKPPPPAGAVVPRPPGQ